MNVRFVDEPVNSQFRNFLFGVLVLDCLGCFALDRALLWLFGDMRLRSYS